MGNDKTNVASVEDLPKHAPIGKKKERKSLPTIDLRYRWLSSPQLPEEWYRLLKHEMNTIATVLKMQGLDMGSFNWPNIKNKELSFTSNVHHAITLGQYFTKLIRDENHEEINDYLSVCIDLAKNKNFFTHPGFRRMELLTKSHDICFETENQINVNNDDNNDNQSSAPKEE